ncbi:hypothetical protein [Knoellia koreensis]|uniref:Uncharacterized protein n=1 Tax=Knoellia koreensis TaxID=2730921 RepID=A0A849H7P9_9MICO|nr:hypothetical protein [Knoellia sp. DB2414S]NNM45880.1 hypothetical protein [Knoellia sp. DB2414S]
MGRHRGSARHPLVLVAVLTVVAVLLAGGGAYAVWRAFDEPSPGEVAPTVTAGGGSSVGAESVETTGPGTTGPSSSTTSGSSTTGSSTSSGPSAEATAALQRCVTTVRAQESLAKAVAGSAASWQTHTDAQRRMEAGTFTAAQTAAAWARSKARGPADLKAYATANAAVKQAGQGCADVDAKTAGSPLAAKASACAERSTRLAAVQAAGGKVQSEWSAHIAMMANKAHTNKAAYHERWLGMVKDAGPTLTAYRTAAAAAAKAPACTA